MFITLPSPTSPRPPASTPPRFDPAPSPPYLPAPLCARSLPLLPLTDSQLACTSARVSASPDTIIATPSTRGVTRPSDLHVPVKSLRPAPRLAARSGLASVATPAEERDPADVGPVRVNYNHVYITKNKAGVAQTTSAQL